MFNVLFVLALLIWALCTTPFSMVLLVFGGGLLLHGFVQSLKVEIAAEVKKELATPPPPRPCAPAPPLDVKPPFHPEDQLPLLPWTPLTNEGKAYRTRQLAYRRDHGLPIANASSPSPALSSSLP